MAEGRYLISADAVKTREPENVVVHDTQHLDERCNTDAIKHRIHFNDLNWALVDKNYRPCEHCMGEAKGES